MEHEFGRRHSLYVLPPSPSPSLSTSTFSSVYLQAACAAATESAINPHAQTQTQRRLNLALLHPLYPARQRHHDPGQASPTHSIRSYSSSGSIGSSSSSSSIHCQGRCPVPAPANSSHGISVQVRVCSPISVPTATNTLSLSPRGDCSCYCLSPRNFLCVESESGSLSSHHSKARANTDEGRDDRGRGRDRQLRGILPVVPAPAHINVMEQSKNREEDDADGSDFSDDDSQASMYVEVCSMDEGEGGGYLGYGRDESDGVDGDDDLYRRYKGIGIGTRTGVYGLDSDCESWLGESDCDRDDDDDRDGEHGRGDSVGKKRARERCSSQASSSSQTSQDSAEAGAGSSVLFGVSGSVNSCCSNSESLPGEQLRSFKNHSNHPNNNQIPRGDMAIRGKKRRHEHAHGEPWQHA